MSARDDFSPKQPKPEVLTIEGIRADVEHCQRLEDAKDPCYHCRQKLFLLQQISIRQGLIESARGEVSSLGDFSKYAEEDHDSPGTPALEQPVAEQQS